MANKKNSKKNNNKKKAPAIEEIKEQKIQEQAAEVIEEKAAEVTKDTVVLEPGEVIEEAAEITDASEGAAPEVEVLEPASEYAAPEEVIEVSAPEVIEPVSEAADEAPAEEAAPEVEVPESVVEDTVPDEVIEAEEPEVVEEKAADEAPAEVTDFTLVMDAGQGHVSPEEEKLAAEYAAARAEGPAASTAITPIVPVTGYGDDSKTVEFKAPKAAKEPKESKLKGFFDKPVSRKFLAGALGLALVLNGLIAAGIMALFANDLEDDISAVKKSVKELEENSGNMGGGPGMGMTPPDWNSDNGNGNGFYGRDDSDSGDYWDDDWDDDDWGSSAPGNQQNGDQNSQQIQQNSGNVSIGIVIRDNNGVYISQVTGSNAKKAGFQEGDKIVEFDGDDIDNSNELIEEVQEHKAGDKVTVVIERNGKQQKITTTLE